MEINVDVSRKDFSNFNKYYFFHKGIKTRLIIYFIMIIIIPIIMNIGTNFNFIVVLINFLGTAVIFGVVFFGLGYLSMNFAGKLPSANGAILGKRKFTIADEGLIEESDSNTNIQKWNSIKSIEQNNQLIIVFIDKIAAYVIPKRFFNDNEQMNLFIENMKIKIVE